MKNLLSKIRLKTLLYFILYFIIGYIAIEIVEYFLEETLKYYKYSYIIIILLYSTKYHIFCCVAPFLYATYKCNHKNKCQHKHCN